MTVVTIYRDASGGVIGFRAEGHAAERVKRGGDIVCSAVSVLANTAANALESIAALPTASTVRAAGDGLLDVRLPSNVPEARLSACDIILRTVQQGFMDIAEAYPAQVRVVFNGEP